MDRKTIIKKKRILSRITVKQYRELLSFVEDFYLADYSLKILVARKGSNLFSALIDLVREEDGGRVRQLYEKKFAQKKKPIIISDRALDYYAEDIKNGVYTSILIGDDTIRHGRTIFGLYEKVHELLEQTADSRLDLCAFAACREAMPKSERSENVNTKKQVNLGEYRAISDMVIDVLSLAGQPYTSYVPNITLQKEMPLYSVVIDMIKEMEDWSKNDPEQEKLELCAAIWISPETPKFAMLQSIRSYQYDDLEQCTLVPMVSLQPISDNSLLKYGEILRDFIQEAYYEKVFFRCRELSYRTIIYVISSLYLRQFIREKTSYADALPDLENLQEEKLNFGEQILNQQILNQMSAQDIAKIMEKLEEEYCKVDLQEMIQTDSSVRGLYDAITSWVNEPSFRQTKMEDAVKQFFSINSDWNEIVWKEKESQKEAGPRCPCDYPFICLSDQATAEDRDKGEFYAQILKAIDYGRGSIVAREKRKGEKKYYLPFLSAGERSYKYKQEKYFPVLYGLLEIERSAAEKNMDPADKKKDFVKKIPKHGEYDEKELESFCNTDITTQYKPVLLKDVWFYTNGEEVEQALALAQNIMQ